MIFDVSDTTYDRFMGRYSVRLAPQFADFAGVEPGHRVLDVGAGTGALTAELVARLGAGFVASAEPSPRFVAALRERFPDVDVREAPAEELPWPDASFDVVLAQLVMSFVADAAAATRELHRVVRPGGSVALCMWEEDGLELGAPLQAARDAVVPEAPGPRKLRYRTETELRELLVGTGLGERQAARLDVRSDYAGFDEYWDAAAAMPGPDTAWLRELDDTQRAAVREEVRRQLGSPAGAFTLGARAVAVKATRA